MDYSKIEKLSLKDVQEAVNRSSFLMEEIKKQEKERGKIASLLADFMRREDITVYQTEKKTIRLIQGLSKSLSKLKQEEKTKLHYWAVENHPEILAVQYTKLLNLLNNKEDVELPIPLHRKGFSVRVVKKNKELQQESFKEIKKDQEKAQLLQSSQTPKEPTRNPLDGWGRKSKEEEEAEKKQKKVTTRQQSLIRLASMQDMWDEGIKYADIARAHDMSPSYTKKLLKPYERQRIYEIRNSKAFDEPLKPAGPPMFSTEI